MMQLKNRKKIEHSSCAGCHMPIIPATWVAVAKKGGLSPTFPDMPGQHIESKMKSK